MPQSLQDDLFDNLKNVTRIEIIDDMGRAYVNMDVYDVKLSMQDEGKALKVFLKNG